MNATAAVKRNEELLNDLIDFSKDMAKRMNITLKEAIEKKVAIYVKYSKTSNEAIAWGLRGQKAIELI